MAENTKIEWADSTANLWIGCTKISPACDHCYAERDWDIRRKWVTWGPHGDRYYAKAGWQLLRRLQKAAAANGGVDPELGRRRRVFVNSLSDTFDNHKSILWRNEAFALFEECRHVIIMLVTKRPENVMKMVPSHWVANWPENVWLICTAENQKRAEHVFAEMGKIKAPIRMRGLSMEPLLEPVKLTDLRPDGDNFVVNALNGKGKHMLGMQAHTAKLDWVILGGESGGHARKTELSWIEAIVDDCLQHGTPVFVKQLGIRHGKSHGDITTFPDALRMRLFPRG